MARSEEMKEAMRMLNAGLGKTKKSLRARLRKEESFGIIKRNNSIATGILAADKAAREKRRQRARGRAAKNQQSANQSQERTDRRGSDRDDTDDKNDRSSASIPG